MALPEFQALRVRIRGKVYLVRSLQRHRRRAQGVDTRAEVRDVLGAKSKRLQFRIFEAAMDRPLVFALGIHSIQPATIPRKTNTPIASGAPMAATRRPPLPRRRCAPARGYPFHHRCDSDLPFPMPRPEDLTLRRWSSRRWDCLSDAVPARVHANPGLRASGTGCRPRQSARRSGAREPGS